MNNLKKTSVSVLMLVLGSLILTGCNKSTTPEEAPTVNDLVKEIDEGNVEGGNDAEDVDAEIDEDIDAKDEDVDAEQENDEDTDNSEDEEAQEAPEIDVDTAEEALEEANAEGDELVEASDDEDEELDVQKFEDPGVEEIFEVLEELLQ